MNKIFELVEEERIRQENNICLIASENLVSQEVLNLSGCCLTQKYAEGYPSHRYYGGCEVVDKIEQYAIDKAKKLFKCKWANVQPHSGSQANQAVYLALCKPGDTILGMDLNAGGHLTHGSKVSCSGKLYNSISYGVDEKGIINYEEIKEKLYKYNPKLLIVGASAYPRIIDFEKIRKIVDEYNEKNTYEGYENYLIREYDNKGMERPQERISFYNNYCYLMVDMAHIAGLVATGLHPSPLPYADVVTSTTHKTLRGPRGGLILSNNEEIGKLIDKAVFPGIQGGPLEHIIAAKAQCFDEALQPNFKTYIEKVVENCKYMAEGFMLRGINVVTNGTDNHLFLLDLTNLGITGKQVEIELNKIGISVNKNMIPNDKLKPNETSGIRIGTAAVTTKGIDTPTLEILTGLIYRVLIDIKEYGSIPENKLKNYINTKNLIIKHLRGSNDSIRVL